MCWWNIWLLHQKRWGESSSALRHVSRLGNPSVTSPELGLLTTLKLEHFHLVWVFSVLQIQERYNTEPLQKSLKVCKDTKTEWVQAAKIVLSLTHTRRKANIFGSHYPSWLGRSCAGRLNVNPRIKNIFQTRRKFPISLSLSLLPPLSGLLALAAFFFSPSVSSHHCTAGWISGATFVDFS